MNNKEQTNNIIIAMKRSYIIKTDTFTHQFIGLFSRVTIKFIGCHKS